MPTSSQSLRNTISIYSWDKSLIINFRRSYKKVDFWFPLLACLQELQSKMKFCSQEMKEHLQLRGVRPFLRSAIHSTSTHICHCQGHCTALCFFLVVFPDILALMEGVRMLGNHSFRRSRGEDLSTADCPCVCLKLISIPWRGGAWGRCETSGVRHLPNSILLPAAN